MAVIRAHDLESARSIKIKLLREKILKYDVALLEIWRVDIGDIVADDLLSEVRRSHTALHDVKRPVAYDLLQHCGVPHPFP